MIVLAKIQPTKACITPAMRLGASFRAQFVLCTYFGTNEYSWALYGMLLHDLWDQWHRFVQDLLLERYY